MWHPLADGCVLALTRDGLALYDVTAAGEAAAVGAPPPPPRTWLLPPSVAAAAPAALALGAPRGWELLTAFVATAGVPGGAGPGVHYLCPLPLPAGCLLPAGDWAELLEEAAAAAVAVGEGASSAAVAAAGSVHVSWLRDCWRDVDGEPGWRRYAPSPSFAAAGDGGSRSLAPALQGPVATEPAFAALAALPGTRGALAPLVDVALLPPAASPAATAALLLLGDGRLVGMRASEPVVPAWGAPARAYDGWELRGTAPGQALSGGGDGDGSAARAAPWLVEDAVSLPMGGHPLDVARAALAAGGAAYAGGSPGAGVAGAGPATTSAAGDLVHAPSLLLDAGRPGWVVAASRRGVWVVQCGWALASPSSALPPPPRRAGGVLQLVGAGEEGGLVDVMGVAVSSGDAPDGGGGLLTWTVRAEEAAEVPGADGVGGEQGSAALLPGAVRDVSAALLGGAGLLDTSANGELEPPQPAKSTAPTANELLRLPPLTTVVAEYAGLLADAAGGGASVAHDAGIPSSRRRRGAGDGDSGTGALPSDAPALMAALAGGAAGVQRTAAALGALRGKTVARASLLVNAAGAVQGSAAALAADVTAASSAAAASARRLALLAAGAANAKARAEAVLLALALRRGRPTREEGAAAAEIAAMRDELAGRSAAAMARVGEGVMALEASAAALPPAGGGGSAPLPESRLAEAHAALAAVAEAAGARSAAVVALREALAEASARATGDAAACG